MTDLRNRLTPENRQFRSYFKLFCLCPVLILLLAGCRDRLAEQRSAFLLAEKYITEQNEAGFLSASAGLSDYPLYPYLRYQWLKMRLERNDEISRFLTEYKTTRYAPLLRSQWLDFLAARNLWPEFLQNYQVNERTAGDCRWHWANYQTGKQKEALAAAKQLWLNGSVGEECKALFSALTGSTLLSSAEKWRRFETTLFQNKPEPAKSAAGLLEKEEKNKARDWLLLQTQPSLLTEPRFWKNKGERESRLFAHAIMQLADKEAEKAIQIWQLKEQAFKLDQPARQAVERKLGMELLADKNPGAYDWLNKLTAPDEETRQAKLRAALLAPDWQKVLEAMAGLTEAERQEPKAKYWLARALAQTGNPQQAQSIYTELAKDRSFYGFLAADLLNQPYQLTERPVKPEMELLAQLSEEPDVKACQELAFFGRKLELRRHWQFAVQSLPKEKLLAAAKLAQIRQWDQLAIITLVKAGYWDDMVLRFPVRYLAEVNLAAQTQNLDPAFIFGLMRQESMLDPDATSSAGARGLMQLMPPTARTLAAQLKQPWLNDNDLYRPEVNIRYGSYYLRLLLDRFGNQLPAVTAAYNAGPNRVRQWLPAQSAVRADIWIETIPYKETRKYVSNVLSYALIYQSRLKKSGLRLTDLLKDIRPG